MTQPIGRKLLPIRDKRLSFPSVEELNALFTPLGFKDRIRALYEYLDNSEVLFTSSFGTRSIFLLHLVHQIQPSQPIHFIDTLYHFPETIAYKNQLIELLGLKVKDVFPKAEEHMITLDEQWWKDHPRMCCTINKIAPLDPIVSRHKVWISGLMAWQTEYRSRLRVFVQQGDIIKFHPLIDIDEGEMHFHTDRYKLPRHPLELQGFGSVGCTHCTAKGDGRSGRWQGTGKTECGLHPNYFKKKG